MSKKTCASCVLIVIKDPLAQIQMFQYEEEDLDSLATHVLASHVKED